MSRQPKIRWRESDRQNINREVRRFNSKLDRLASANPGIAEYLPERLSVREIKGGITTRAELHRVYNSIDRLFKKDAARIIETQSGLKLTKYERREVAIKVGIINRARTIERKAAGVSTEKGTMGAIKEQNLAPKPFNIQAIRPGKEWEKYKESVEKQSQAKYKTVKMELYKANYLKAVKDNLGKAGKELYNTVKGLDAKTIYDNYYDDPILQIGFIYDPIDQQSISDAALDRWDSIISEDGGADE